MGERHDVKVAFEFAIYAAKKIEIELANVEKANLVPEF